jgi:hypothetical protein
VTTSEPLAYGLPGHTWTVKKVQQWARQVWGCVVSRTTVRQALRQAGLRWKKGQKVLKKADPVERAAYVQAFQAVYDRFCRGEIHLLYVDEAHFHQEMDLGYTWAVCGQPVWRLSTTVVVVVRHCSFDVDSENAWQSLDDVCANATK